MRLFVLLSKIQGKPQKLKWTKRKWIALREKAIPLVKTNTLLTGGVDFDWNKISSSTKKSEPSQKFLAKEKSHHHWDIRFLWNFDDAHVFGWKSAHHFFILDLHLSGGNTVCWKWVWVFSLTGTKLPVNSRQTREFDLTSITSGPQLWKVWAVNKEAETSGTKRPKAAVPFGRKIERMFNALTAENI